MEFKVLGPLEVVDRERALPLGPAKQRALLALLLLHANELVSRDRLVDDLWGEKPPATASHAVEVYVSQLRKLLQPAREAPPRLQTRSPGYVLRVARGELDLHRFEDLFERAAAELAEGNAAHASQTLREALGLWRGPALADVTYESFAQAEISRLEELRLAAVEARVDADLALGRHSALVGELERLVAKHPLRERLRGQLMLALYRSGRQAEALQVYEETRRVLVDDLGLEPTPALNGLQAAILRHDPDVGAPAQVVDAVAHGRSTTRSILIAPFADASVSALLDIAEPLARFEPGHELILACLVGRAEDLPAATEAVHGCRSDLVRRGVAARALSFTSKAVATDVVRLAKEQDVDLLLSDLPADVLATGMPSHDVAHVLAHAPCDVGLLGPGASLPPSRVLVPFSGADHDWSALEVAAWIARARESSLALIGAAGDPKRGARDASRLLATASLLIQRYLGVAAEPILFQPRIDALLDVVGEADLLVVGFSDRWRSEGLGMTRLAVAGRARALFVRRGARPGGLAPRDSLTRFTWSLSGATRARGQAPGTRELRGTASAT